MNIKKLLFVTEFDDLWFDALESLMELRKSGLDHVVFLHVIDREKVAQHRGVGYLKTEEIKLKEMANVRFIDWAESLFEQGMEVGAHIVVGSQIPKIVSIANDEDVDLIVTGFHKKGKFKNIYSDSEIMEIMRRSLKPIMIHKYKLDSGKVNDTPFKKPLLVLDLTSPVDNIVKYILGFKDVIEKIQVIHVASEKSLKSSSAMDVQKVRKDTRQKLDEICESFRSEGLDADQHLYIGDVIHQIERAAEERQATMIIGGTPGKGPWKERWLGSIPRKLVEKSAFPTLFIPPGLEIKSETE